MLASVTRFLALCSLVAIAACGGDAADISGEWKVIEFEGDAVPAAEQTRWTFDDTTVTVDPVTGDTLSGTYEVDDTTDPKQIDVTITGAPVALGIYDLLDDGETLLIKIADEGGARPTDFVAEPGPESGTDLMKFERQ